MSPTNAPPPAGASQARRDDAASGIWLVLWDVLEKAATLASLVTFGLFVYAFQQWRWISHMYNVSLSTQEQAMLRELVSQIGVGPRHRLNRAELEASIRRAAGQNVLDIRAFIDRMAAERFLKIDAGGEVHAVLDPIRQCARISLLINREMPKA